MKKGIPRKKPEELPEYGRRLAGKVDVLLLHESLYIPEYHGGILHDERMVAVAIAKI